MFDVYKMKKLIKKYQDVLDEYLKDYEIVSITANTINFNNKYDDTLELTLEENLSEIIITLKEKNRNINKTILVTIPKLDKKSSIRTKETIIEERKNGTIVEVVKKDYDFTEYSTKRRYVTSLSANRYVLEPMSDILDLENEKNVKSIAVYKSYFSSFLFSYSLFGASKEANNIVRNDIRSLSNIYASIKGPEKVEKIYYLYNGIINAKTKDILLKIKEGSISSELYDFKTKSGITAKENSLVGEPAINTQYVNYVKNFFRFHMFYPKEVNPYSREEIIKALNYKTSAPEIAKINIERALDISYEEFDNMDFDEQQRIIKEYHEKNNNKKAKTKKYFKEIN